MTFCCNHKWVCRRQNCPWAYIDIFVGSDFKDHCQAWRPLGQHSTSHNSFDTDFWYEFFHFILMNLSLPGDANHCALHRQSECEAQPGHLDLRSRPLSQGTHLGLTCLWWTASEFFCVKKAFIWLRGTSATFTHKTSFADTGIRTHDLLTHLFYDWSLCPFW